MRSLALSFVINKSNKICARVRAEKLRPRRTITTRPAARGDRQRREGEGVEQCKKKGGEGSGGWEGAKVLCDLVFGHNNIANRSVVQCTHNYRANVCDGR